MSFNLNFPSIKILFGPRLPSFPFVSQLFKAAPLIGSSGAPLEQCGAVMQGERQRQSVGAREFQSLEGRLDHGLKVLGSHEESVF